MLITLFQNRFSLHTKVYVLFSSNHRRAFIEIQDLHYDSVQKKELSRAITQKRYEYIGIIEIIDKYS